MKPRLLLTSDEKWGPVWHTQLYYADQLSKYFRVHFLEPPTKWTFNKLSGPGMIYREIINDSLERTTYHNYLPSSIGSVATNINDRMNQKHLNSLWQDEAPDIVWHFDPYRGYDLFRKSGIIHIYHVIDPYFDKPLDRRFATESDIVIVTSPKFHDYYSKFNEKTLLIQQGIDDKILHTSRDRNQLAAGSRIALLGTISNHVNIHMVNQIAAIDEVELVIIGPDLISDPDKKELFRRITARDNVRWTGPLPPKEFIPILQEIDLGIITYYRNDVGRNEMRSPLKVISYLAQGIPVITNIDCEIPSLMGKGIFYAENDLQYISLIEKGISGSLNFASEEVRSYLESISYSNLIREIFSHLDYNLPAE